MEKDEAYLAEDDMELVAIIADASVNEFQRLKADLLRKALADTPLIEAPWKEHDDTQTGV